MCVMCFQFSAKVSFLPTPQRRCSKYFLLFLLACYFSDSFLYSPLPLSRQRWYFLAYNVLYFACNWTTRLVDFAYMFASLLHGLQTKRVNRELLGVVLSWHNFVCEKKVETNFFLYNRRIKIGHIKWLQDC